MLVIMLQPRSVLVSAHTLTVLKTVVGTVLTCNSNSATDNVISAISRLYSQRGDCTKEINSFCPFPCRELQILDYST